ncbi:MAG: hypothetical protein AAFP17_03950 [Pseudomonadota bacterium]
MFLLNSAVATAATTAGLAAGIGAGLAAAIAFHGAAAMQERMKK